MASARWARSPTAWAIRASRTSATSSSGSSGRRQVPIAAFARAGSPWTGFEAGASPLATPPKGQKSFFCGLRPLRKDKKHFFVACDPSQGAKIIFLWLATPRKGQKSFFCGLRPLARGKKHFSAACDPSERAKNTFLWLVTPREPFPEACKFLP